MSSLNGHFTTGQIFNPEILDPHNVTWIRNVNIQSGGILSLSYMWKVCVMLALSLIYLVIAVPTHDSISAEGFFAFMIVAALAGATAFFLITGIAQRGSLIVSDNEITFTSWWGTTTWPCTDIGRCALMASSQSDRNSMRIGLGLGVGLVLLNNILAIVMLLNDDPFFWVVLLIMLMCVAVLPAMHHDWTTNVTVKLISRPAPSMQPHTLYIRCRSEQARTLASSLYSHRAGRADMFQALEHI